MNAIVQTDGKTHESDVGTLGALLYADKSKARVPEKWWVDLLRAIGAGDQRALHELYERTHRLVFTLAMRICKNRDTAEELTLDVFHDVWRRAAGYDPKGGTVVGWIMNQARSRAIDRLRFEQRKKRVNPHPDDSSSAEETPDTGELLDLHEQGIHVQKALAVLTTEERRAIEAAFFSGLTYIEVAARHKQPIGTVKTRIRSGLSKLRQELGIG